MTDQPTNQPGQPSSANQPAGGKKPGFDFNQIVSWCKENPVLAVIILIVVLLILWAIF